MSDVEAERAITQALARYCRAWDRADIPLALSVWHTDGTAQYLAEPVRPVAEMIPERLEARRRQGLTTSHQITNLVVEVAGERAVSEAYGTAWAQQRTDTGEIFEQHYFSRYLDRWSRRGGVWAIDHRRVVLDGYSHRTFAPDPALEAAMGAARMDETDPSYPHFAL